MKQMLTLCAMLMTALAVSASSLYNVPAFRVQPDGDTLRCLLSGDEYYQRLHDTAGYTIVLNPQSGWWVYADTMHTAGNRWSLVPTDYVAGRVDPRSIRGLSPNLGIDRETWMERQRLFDGTGPKGVNTAKTSGANHGTMNNLVVFIRFSDQNEITTQLSVIDSLLNDSSANATSMYSYFKAVSYNKLKITSHIFPTPLGDSVVSYQDIYPRSYYLPDYGNNTGGYQTEDERRSREKALVERALTFVNTHSTVPASLDLDMDNDGNVDNVCFIVEGAAYNGLLWPHMSTLSDRYVYMGGKRVFNYTFQLGQSSGYLVPGVLCHEMFHTLGAPDLYKETGTQMSIGPWDLMSNNSLVHMGAYMKWRYGNWLDSIPTITRPGRYSLHPLGDTSSDNCCYKIATPHPNQWYVLEYRDSSKRFENTLPGTGLLIYRIDDRYRGNYSTLQPDEVYLFRHSSSTMAQDLAALRNAHFSGSTPRTAFTPETDPFPFLTDSTPDLSFAIIDISVPDSIISFTYAPICLAPTDLTASGITDTSATLEWQASADSVLLQWHAVGEATVYTVVTGGHSYRIDTLSPDTEYEWRVKSICFAGDSSEFTPWSSFATTQCLQHEVTIAGGNTNSHALPFNTWYKYSWTQMIFTASELGDAKEITALAFYYLDSNPLTYKDSCVIYIGHTADSAISTYSSSPQFLPASTMHIVYEGPISCTFGWNTIEFDRPFYYNGTDNLVVAIDDNSAAGYFPLYFRCTQTPGRYSSVTCFSDDVNPDPAGNNFPYYPNREYYQYRADIRFTGCNLEAMPTFEVSVASSDSLMGSATGGGTYDVYTPVTVTATPTPNHRFLYWLSGGDTVTANPYTFVLYTDSALVAHFAAENHYIHVASSDTAIGRASIVCSDGTWCSQDSLPHGTLVQLHAEARSDVEGVLCRFLQWSDGISEAERTLTLTQDTLLMAIFESNPLGISSADGQSRVTVSAGCIEIANATGEEVALYDAIGRCHWREKANGQVLIHNVRPGVYVLRLGGTTHKVVVR